MASTAAMPPNVTSFSTLRARSYVGRLPVFTRTVIAIIALCWVASLQSVWDIRRWGALIPDQVSLTSGESSNLQSEVRGYCDDGRLLTEPTWDGQRTG